MIKNEQPPLQTVTECVFGKIINGAHQELFKITALHEGMVGFSAQFSTEAPPHGFMIGVLDKDGAMHEFNLIPVPEIMTMRQSP